MSTTINTDKYVGVGKRYIILPTDTCDADAQTFITAAGITNATQIAAICQLVADLKSTGVWTSLTAIYPFVGGSATTHRYNLKNPSTYQITWFGGVTHSANGVQFNNINSYGDPGYVESTIETFGRTHRAIYDRTNTTDFGCQIGAQGAGGAYQRNYMADKYNGNYYMDIYDVQDFYGRLTGVSADSRAFWLNSRSSLGAGGFKVYRNGVSINTTTNANVGSQPNVGTWIGGLNANGSLSQPTGHQLAFASMGTNLTGTQVSSYYTAVQTFQTTLGRQI